eukprot:jgi/Ulvmu1/7437/UM036_0098.1
MILRRSRDVLLFRLAQSVHQRIEPNWRAFCSTNTKPSNGSSSSTDPKEVEKFAALASEWWSPTGPVKALHELNNARVHFIKEASRHALARNEFPSAPLKDVDVLDVGCGGGILAEALARLGGQVTGIDVTRENIMVAKEHMRRDVAFSSRLRYRDTSAESLLTESPGAYDVVIASEVIEHVSKPLAFCQTLSELTAPNGCVVITTFNRTPASYALAIIAAERMLGMVPQGAHDWNKFITPEELALMFADTGMTMSHLTGMQLSPVSRKWECVQNTGVNYAAAFVHSDRASTLMLDRDGDSN